MSVPFAEAFSGRSVFVTGHTGFMGSWLSIWLHRLGARATGYALAPHTDPSNFEVSEVRGTLVAHHEGDIRDAAALGRAIRTADPDVVFHLAAQPIVRESYSQPRETFEVNVIGTCSLLDCARQLARPCIVVVVTSDKCYENREDGRAFRENDPVGGGDPYSASKGATEILVSSYRRSFFDPERTQEHGVKLATARAGNMIGGGDWSKDRIIPDVVRALCDKRPVPVRNPRGVRPWQHVLEPLSGMLVLVGRMLESDDPRLCDAWNFGPLPAGDIPVRRLVDMSIKAWGEGSWEDVGDLNQPREAGVLRLAIDKARSELGWRPRWGLREAVAHTAEWYRRSYGNEGSMRQACLDDISAYEAAE